MNYPSPNDFSSSGWDVKRHFHAQLNSASSNFILKSFFKASLMFLVFGILALFTTWGFGILIVRLAGSNNGFGSLQSFAWLLAFVPLFAGHAFYRKWSNDVEYASRNTIVWSFLLLGAAYLLLISLALSFATAIDLVYVVNQNNILGLTYGAIFNLTARNTLIVFAGSWLVYLVPAAIGRFFIKRNKTAQNLSRIIVISQTIMIVLFISYFILWFFAGNLGNRFSPYAGLLFMVLFGVVVLLMPIVSFFKFRKIAAVIDYADPHAVNNWSLFFAFTIFIQLLDVAYLLSLLMRWRNIR
ncbi:hypothetical protein J2Z62_000087 [Mycoplasmoides fastidiosum]|uniref:Uncharacterized protein n=1 Tax=Mycoplasmoides fastidiosum TaxID=92758 RepID=A0ABU0LY66_9BACT|nr:hypothetical protein [Mycoplasmoides fastidiosum]MDQ0513649.1 hypothetical protein [Mycoplasmoides fastidiosum]UUD37931.1 hypothetical protein NPA10_00850 [Mycoplasmoides fastidiosum]